MGDSNKVVTTIWNPIIIKEHIIFQYSQQFYIVNWLN